ncbi:MAG TPA: hypothetical protein VH482_17890 [Thermomicrobiales bacterium]|jgi:hypothetical protein
MTSYSDTLRSDPRIQAAVAEMKDLISAHFPGTTYVVSIGDDPVGVYLDAIVDIDDPDEVMDLIIDRLLVLQVDELLPFYVIPLRTLERVLASMEQDKLFSAASAVLQSARS